ncbi:MAG: Arm DNA-binding domain-containing protein, partial [SAR324 cluster bacterium]|nr:Arm DNA-binding domain-containing protein [SAR324 cluster bacterium]
MKSHKLTQAYVKALPIPEAGRPTYYDQTIRGLGLRITPAGRKSWILYRRVNGKAHLITLGQFPGLSESKARQAAQAQLGKIALGADPAKERLKAKAEAAMKKVVVGYTLAEALVDFRTGRAHKLRSKTLDKYENSLKRYLPDWLPIPVAAITRNMVMQRHR